MVVKRPTVEEFFRIAEEYNLNPSPADVESFIELSQPILDSYAGWTSLPRPACRSNTRGPQGRDPNQKTIRWGLGTGVAK